MSRSLLHAQINALTEQNQWLHRKKSLGLMKPGCCGCPFTGIGAALLLPALCHRLSRMGPCLLRPFLRGLELPEELFPHVRKGGAEGRFLCGFGDCVWKLLQPSVFPVS